MKRNLLLISIVSLISALYSCKEDEVQPEYQETKEEEAVDIFADFEIPAYADDYSAIAGWNQRSSWNLANVHDPSVVKDGNYYYMYGTDASYGNAHEGHGHFFYRRSDDLVNWKFEGPAMMDAPVWIKDTLNSMRADAGLAPLDNPSYGFWAPVVRKVGDKFRMYYSVVVDNFIGNGLINNLANFDNTWTERAFIGMMETSSLLLNTWEDKGMVICSVSDKGTDWFRSSYTNDWNAYFKYNAIDPSFVITPEGEHWLFYGSWHSGIMALEMDTETGLPKVAFDSSDETTWGTCVYKRNNSRWQGSEGPEVIYNNGYYYMFLAYDELSVAYNTRVCRAESIAGPYYDWFGNNRSNGGECYPVVTHPYQFKGHSGWVGISHCGVFQKEDTGDWFFTSQARLPANTNGNAYSNAIMMGQVRKIRWTDDGWPVVMPERYTAVPDKIIDDKELIGSWENITLNYEYGVQQNSIKLTLSSDYTASGAIFGTWSFDAENNILTIGNTKVYVEREVDWEAEERTITIIYSGITTNGKTLWGKKIADS